jgi:predicted glycoside hydrolase/deacetylase ChbG (UPF0249 family)
MLGHGPATEDDTNLLAGVIRRLGLRRYGVGLKIQSQPSEPDPNSLVARLGLGADARAAIVNCDDLGSSRPANEAIVEALTNGVATSASLMVPCPCAREAAEMSKGMDVGVHLTLTSEYPRYRWGSLTGAASLEDPDGAFPAKSVPAAATPDDVRRECRAQIEQAYAWGVDVTHLDSHMFTVQSDPRFYEVYLELAAEFRLPVRMAERGAEQRLGFPVREPAARLGLAHPDDFVFHWGYPIDTVVKRQLPALGPGLTEFIIHPVVDGPELRGYDTDAAWVRASDHAWATSARAAAQFEAEEIQLIGFRPLRDLQRRETCTAPGEVPAAAPPA